MRATDSLVSSMPAPLPLSVSWIANDKLIESLQKTLSPRPPVFWVIFI